MNNDRTNSQSPSEEVHYQNIPVRLLYHKNESLT